MVIVDNQETQRSVGATKCMFYFKFQEIYIYTNNQ